MEDKLNKIIQMDCLEYLKSLPDGCVDLVLIDPPYLIDTKGRNEFLEKKMKKKVFDDLKYISKGITNDVLEEICRVSKKINCYIFCSKKQIPNLLNYFIKKKCHFDILTWNKMNPVPLFNNTYLPDTEYILFFRESGAYFGGSYKTKRKFYVSNLNTADKKLYGHPTCKPVELLKNYIVNSSKENDIVLDCFAGSGSLAQACLETNRNFLCCERDEGYVKIANDRIENWKEDLLRQDKWLNDRGVMDFESDIKEQAKQEQTQETLI